jgi:2,3-bisphosphoglycerate-independent phosphoglycerate mutase
MQALDPSEAAYFVACDHLTPIAKRTHVSDPVPFLLAGPGIKASGAPAFNEKTAAASNLLIDEGHELLPFVLQSLGLK